MGTKSMFGSGCGFYKPTDIIVGVSTTIMGMKLLITIIVM
jgi:hypothetical protein